jgi:dTDP-4-dehydrorhamnose reductase
VTRILITGASGLLGINLALEALAKYDVVGVLHHAELRDPGFQTIQADLLEPDAIASLLDQTKPDWVINCAALANLDTCERQPELAQRLNAEMPGRLAAEAGKRKLRFMHISTDAVFDGSKGNYREEDSPSPINVYGRTKRLSELAVKSAHPGTIIVRPNFFGWSIAGNRSLAEFFYNNLVAGKQVEGFTDRLFCPILVNDLAAVLLEMLASNLRGIWHVAGSDSLSKFDFGQAIAKRFELDPDLVKPALTETNGGAPRSSDLTLKTSKVAKAIGRRMPAVADGIEKLFSLHVAGYRAKLRSLAAVQEPIHG